MVTYDFEPSQLGATNNAKKQVVTYDFEPSHLGDKQNAFTIGIFTWNLGFHASYDDVFNVVEEISKQGGAQQPALLVVGFQEVDRDENRLTQMLREALRDTYTDVFTMNTAHKNHSACVSPFKIMTLAFVHKRLVKNSQPVGVIQSAVPVCEGRMNFGTKGFVCTRIFINGVTLTFVNTHAPFKSEEKSMAFFSDMMYRLQNFSSDVLVVFGDVNSRSLLTPECYARDVETCQRSVGPAPGAVNSRAVMRGGWSMPSMPSMFRRQREQASSSLSYSGYCKVRQILEGISFGDSVGSVAAPNDLGKSRTCSAAANSRRGSCAVAPSNIANSAPGIVDLLTSRDLIGNPPCHPQLFKGFSEMPITFMPTYKRHPGTGLFDLVKASRKLGGMFSEEVHGRLPGYADRIFYKTDKRGSRLTGELYTSLPVVGSKHLPVYGVLSIIPGEGAEDDEMTG